jgi:hypothetical protein
MLIPSSVQYDLIIGCSVLSILGSLFIIIVSLRLSDIKITYIRIVVFTAISDLFRSFCFLIPCNYISNHVLIQFISIINDSCFLITIAWSSFISVSLYQVIVKSKEYSTRTYKIWCFLTLICIPAANCLPIITDSHGCSGSICSLNSSAMGNLWRFSIIYIPAWIFIILSIVCCLLVYLSIRNVLIEEEKMILIKKLYLYPLVLIIEVLPLTLSALLLAFSNNDSVDTFDVVSFTLYSLHGFSNALVFGFTTGIKTIYRESYMRSYLSMQDKICDKASDDETEGPNLLFSSVSEADTEVMNHL